MADERVKERGPREAPRGPWDHWKSIALWKQALLVLSVVMMVGAVGVQVYAGASRGPAEPRAQAGEPAPDGPGEPGETSGRGTAPIGIMPGEHETVEPGQTGPAAPAEARGEAASEGEVDVWSPAVFRMGFSFFAGFAIAYALRTFVKVSVIAIGLFLLAMFGLQYAGFIEVNWTVGRAVRLRGRVAQRPVRELHHLRDRLPALRGRRRGRDGARVHEEVGSARAIDDRPCLTYEIGKRIVGIIRAQAKRIDEVRTGGRYVEPVYGRPGASRAASSRSKARPWS